MNCAECMQLREMIDTLNSIMARLKGIQHDRWIIWKERSKHLNSAIANIDDSVGFIFDEIKEEILNEYLLDILLKLDENQRRLQLIQDEKRDCEHKTFKQLDEAITHIHKAIEFIKNLIDE